MKIREKMSVLLEMEYSESTIHDENVVEMTLSEVICKLEEVKSLAETWSEKCIIQSAINKLKD